MEQPTTGAAAASGPKHIKTFWAITIILVVAAIMGGIVYWFQFNFVYDEEIQSLELRMQKRSINTAREVQTETPGSQTSSSTSTKSTK